MADEGAAPASTREATPLIPSTSVPVHQQDGEMPRPIRRKPVPANANIPSQAMSLLSIKDSQRYEQVARDDDSDISPPSTHRKQQMVVKATGRELENRLMPPPTWIPLALRLPSLLVLLAFNIILLASLVAIHTTSATSMGLAMDDGSGLMFFAWRFLPVVVAVSYVFFWMILTDVVNRTEVPARLTKFPASSAVATVLRAPGPWWSTLADSFAGRQNDNRHSLVLCCAVTAYVMGFLILSPFAAALLVSREITLAETVDFLQPQLDEASALQPALDTSTFFRTIGHVMQNVTTSSWIADRYNIVPFWPSGMDQPLGSQFTDQSETWRTKGTVLEATLMCEAMQLSKGPFPMEFELNKTTLAGSGDPATVTDTLQTLMLSSASGCEYGFATPITYSDPAPGWTHWSGAAGTFMPQVWGGALSLSLDTAQPHTVTYTSDPSLLMNYTEACELGYAIVSFIKSDDDSITLDGRLCSPQFFSAELSVDAVSHGGISSFTFDETEYQKLRRPINEGMINVTGFQSSFLQADWVKHLQRGTLKQDTPFLGGPASLLAAMYDFNIPDMVGDAAIETNANTIHRRAFGETLQTALQGVGVLKTIQGERITVERRVIVVQWVALTIEIVLLLHLGCLVILLARSREKRRPLGLSRDYGTTNAIAALVSSRKETTHCFAKPTSALQGESLTQLNNTNFALNNGVLHTEGRSLSTPSTATGKGNKKNKDLKRRQAIPKVLSMWLLLLLCSVFAIILVAIAVLYWYSLDHGLSQAAFVYHTTIEISDTTLGTLAPYSIIPTLLAVGIGLWWGALDSFFRTAQPFVTMAKGDTSAKRGVAVSYQSSYTVWASCRALYRKQWLLASVCTGAFLTQILTIAMSALWQKQPSTVTTVVEARQSLELRQIPLLYFDVDNYKNSEKFEILASLFKDFKTSWMYGAVTQLTLNATEPAWSKDGWSFVPLDLRDILDSGDLESPQGNADGIHRQPINATVQTPALRARLECPRSAYFDDCWQEGVDRVTNSTTYLEPTDPSLFPIGYRLESSIIFGADGSRVDGACDLAAEFNNTPITPQRKIVQCCTAGSMTDPGILSLGYWTPSAVLGVESLDLNVHWMQGLAQTFWNAEFSDWAKLYWLEKPRLSIANCTAVIEKAHADVTVDVATGQVQSYQIIDSPTSDVTAWAEPFVARPRTDGEEMRYSNNITASYGHLFLQALLRAAQVNTVLPCVTCNVNLEDPTDRTFNFQEPGLNVDFMSYTMLSLARNNRSALLDPATMISLAQRTFTIFFQHFASSDVSLDSDSNWAFQRVNASLPTDLTVPSPEALTSRNLTLAPTLSTPGLTAPVALIRVTRPAEILEMSPVAVYLSLSILSILLVTTVLIMALKTRYFIALSDSPVETFADVAALVANSEQYLRLARERGLAALQDEKDFSTRLGWFRYRHDGGDGGGGGGGRDGDIRWGIELVDDETVEWLEKEEFEELRGAAARRKR